MSRCRDAVMAGSGFIMVVLGMLNFATQMKTMTTAEALRYSVKLTLGAMVMFLAEFLQAILTMFLPAGVAI